MEWIKKGIIYNEFHAQVPIVDINHPGFWRIYYSQRENRGPSLPYYLDVEAGNPSNILSKSSEPILKLGAKGFFDWAGIMPTEIIQVGELKYLYYIGWSNRMDVPYHNNLGLAISGDNGETWNKYSDGPIFATSYLEPGFIGTISIIQQNSLFYGFYLSCRKWIESDGHMEPIYDIKIATSENLIDWKPLNKIAIPLENDEGGISKASVMKINDKFYLWFSVRNATDYRKNVTNSYRVKCAQSTDLLTWERTTDLGLNIDLHSSWEDMMVEYPHVFPYKSDIYMFYNGNGFGESGFGYAVLSK